MFSIVLELTTKCNFSCSHCVRGKRMNKDVDINALDVFYSSGHNYGLNFVSLSGGEPILCNNFYDQIRLIVDHGYEFGFVTNGYCYEQYEDLFKYKKQFKEVIVSSDGATVETYRRMRDEKGFDNSWKAIKFFSSRHVPTKLRTILSIANYREYESIIERAIEYGANEIAFGSIIGESPLRLNAQQRIDCWMEIENYAKNRIRVQALSCLGNVPIFRCLAALNSNSIRVSPEGECFSCCDMGKEAGLVGCVSDTFSVIRMRSILLNSSIMSLYTKYFPSRNFTDDYDTCNFCIRNYPEAKKNIQMMLQ